MEISNLQRWATQLALLTSCRAFFLTRLSEAHIQMSRDQLGTKTNSILPSHSGVPAVTEASGLYKLLGCYGHPGPDPIKDVIGNEKDYILLTPVPGENFTAQACVDGCNGSHPMTDKDEGYSHAVVAEGR
jgi:hypothetical protein